ncbi:glycosyltransferase family 39 protein [Rhizobium alvei]|uniref:Glycosyltransferase family 39 protein n=1 Tax=Rhizobium alvei TaxID=1132659 RepID=A0ABT8YLK9_9HYPH|nr:glycosyltransferase family 39 protein [Rhizobium alvei]MDO6964386.1 glycosyltransferase family 39 protein [Rhizobium alvei]
MSPKSIWSRPSVFILIHCLVWWVMTISAKSTLDSYGDMVEVYAWSQHWLLGSDKHPQFLPWMAKLWFLAAPKSVASFYFLSAINLAIALYGIVALGRALKMSEPAVSLALALTVLALPYLTLPGKLNMNAICLSVWPWVVWAFAKALDGRTESRRVHAAAFGVLAAIAMLSKYYSIVLLLPLFAYAFLPSQRGIWRTATPWLAVAVFLLASAPHLYWLVTHSEALAYASEQGTDDTAGQHVKYILKFLAAPLIYWPIPLLVAFAFLARGSLAGRIRQILSPRFVPGLLLFAALGPWLTTILFSVVGLVELSMPWAIPIGFAFTLYIATNVPPQMLAVRSAQLVSAFRFLWPLMIVAGLAIGAVQGLKGRPGFYVPNEEAAAAILANWSKRSALPLSWTAKGNSAANLAFFSDGAVEALPNLPDRMPSYYPPRTNWRQEAGVIICSLEPVGNVDRDCLKEAMNWATTVGLNSAEAILETRRTGVRFPHKVPFEMAVVYVWPG